jgi:hypothetical protein
MLSRQQGECDLSTRALGLAPGLPKDAEGVFDAAGGQKTVFLYRAGDLLSVSAAISPRR